MKNRLNKKLFPTLTAVALLLGAGAVNANTISIVNNDASDLTPSDISIGTDDVGGTFSMDINVILDTGITAGQSVTDITWDAGVLGLSAVSISGTVISGVGTTLPTTGGSYQINVVELTGFYTGEFTLATLLFDYIGPGNTTIALGPVFPVMPANIGWQVAGITTGIAFETINNATVSAIPVPPAMLLFASALVGLGAVGRRKAKA